MRCSAREARPAIGRWRLLAAAVLVLTAVPAAASVASAQTCDQVYGCPPPPTEPGTTPACSLDATAAAAGDTVTAAVTGLDPGEAVQITLDGEVQASGTGDASGNADVSFVVGDLDEGSHPVFAVGAGFSASCGSLTGTAVLGETVTRDGRAGGGSGGGTRGNSLARTGFGIGALLVVAVLLVVLGQRLLAERRRRLRRRNKVAKLPAPPAI